MLSLNPLTSDPCLSLSLSPPSPTKITLIGAVMFSLQHTSYLPLQKHHLMLIYTVFNVVNKVGTRSTRS